MNHHMIAGFMGDGTGNLPSGARNTIASQTLASTTETEIKVNTDTGTAIAVITIPQQTAIHGSGNPQSPSGNPSRLGDPFTSINPDKGSERPYFASQQFDYGRPFLLRWAGVATPASNGANTLTLKVYSGTSKSGTNIITTGALTGTETSTQAGAFWVESKMNWDSVGQILNGEFSYSVSAGATPSYHVWAANSATATVTAVANLSFVATVQWGNAVGGTILTSEFVLYQI